MSLEQLLKQGKKVFSEFSIAPKKTVLQAYNAREYQQFCHVNGFDESDGVFVPQVQRAYVNTGSSHLATTVFHEFFGHGSFVEHSSIGQPVIQTGMNTDYLFEEQPDKSFGIVHPHIGNFEGFALWTELYLSNKLGLTREWTRREARMESDKRELLELFSEQETHLSTRGFLYQLGFPRIYTSQQAADIVRTLHGPSYDQLDIVLLYGSQKPRSDIDVFIISQADTTQFSNGWIDIYHVNREEAESLITKLDISITDPLFTGTRIGGSTAYLTKLQQQVLQQPITAQAINHNYSCAREQQLATHTQLCARDKQTAYSYAHTYELHARALQQGLKKLTKKDLLRRSSVFA